MVFGADIIAGFPTETEDMFRRSLDLVDECGLTHLHVFPYSPRPGTPAARMPQIARDIVMSLQNELPVSSQNIKVVVKYGWVTLEGSVEWNYQRARAEAATRRVRGVKGITNLIAIKPKLDPSNLKRQIEEAFRRSAEVDAQRITVDLGQPRA